MILKNENDIYIYFEAIEQLEPQKVLDIGMFLKRIGGVSRKAMNREVPAYTCLEGIDLFCDIKLPVWETIYDSILTAEAFLADTDKKRYDLAVFLGVEEAAEKLPLLKMAEALAVCAKYMLLDCLPDVWKSYWKNIPVKDLNLEGNHYYLLDFGAKQHGYKNLCNDA